MARPCVLAVLFAGWLSGAALAAPSPRQRVVLADPDPELRHAMEQALAPWRLEVVIEGPPPADAGIAQQRADADTARFVVWRDGEQLVVYDRELDTTERRDSRSGVLDPPTAAAAALTIKTMMRLPPPPPPEEPTPPPPPLATMAEAGIELRLQAGVATRIARGDETDVSMRFGGVVAIRPWASAGWRFGVAGDGGSPVTIDRAGFKGTWREWVAVGVVSWTYTYDAWELEPHAGFGIRRSMLDGAEMSLAHTEAATLTTARGGVWVRWRLARWSIGVALDADETFGTPTYTKTGTAAEFFQIPGIGAELGVLVGVDL